MLQSFLSLLVAIYANKFANSAVIQEDRTVVLPQKYHWETPLILIHYGTDGYLPLYEAVLREVRKSTCIDFRLVTEAEQSVENYLLFSWSPDEICNSVEVKERSCKCPRVLKIGKDCATTSKVLLNVLRALGLHYQHKRHDREKYVELGPSASSWHNIAQMSQTFGLPFDPLSIMHPFTTSREDLRYKDPVTNIIAGTARTLSFYDKKVLNMMYTCDKQCSPSLPNCRNEGYRVHTLGCKCQCPKGFWGEKCEKNANSHHLYNIFTMDEAFHIAYSIKDAIKSKFNPNIAFEAVKVIKDTMIGAIPTALLSEEVSSRDVFAITLGELSYEKWGKEAVTKLGGNVRHLLRDVLKGNLIDIIKAARRNGGDDIVGRALGGTLGIHFTRSLGRGLVCGIIKVGHDTVSGLKWAGGKIEKVGHDTVSGIEWAGGKIKDGFTSVVDFFKDPPGKHYDSSAMYVGMP